MKYSPLVAAIIGALSLTINELFIKQGVTDFKVIGLAALLAVIGVVSVFLQGKPGTLAVIIGTIGFTFYTTWGGESFTWNEFILTAIINVLTVVSASFIPKADPEVTT